MQPEEGLTPTAKLILRDLALGPATTPELKHTLRMKNIYRALAVLRARGLIRICDWESWRFPVWGLGGKRDAQRPPRLTEKERGARHWEKVKLNPERMAQLREKSRVWKRNNPDKVRAIDQVRRQKHREQRLEYARMYRAKNREELNRKGREYYAAKKQLADQSKSQEKTSTPASFTSFIQMVQNAGTSQETPR
jgi:hypothetical protein